MEKNKKSHNNINKYELLKFINKKTGSFIDEVDATFKLINNFSEINALLNKNSDKFKFIYFSKTNIKNILYDCEKEIILDSDKIENSLDKIFYLSLLVKENEEIINYKYSIDYIKQLDKSNENNSLPLRKIIFSKIILDLIDYFRGFEEYNESIESSIDEIKNKNIDIIKYNNNILKEFNLEFKDFINKSIDEIYSDIIKILLGESKDYNVINQLNLEKIDITNFIFKEISKMLSNDKIIIKNRILNVNDLFNKDKIEFYYILLKYILKNICYIYQIPFLIDTRKFILKNKKLIKIDNNNKEKLEYLINTLTGSKYYSDGIEIIQNDDNNDISTLNIINDNLEEDKEINEIDQKSKGNSLEKHLQIKENENQQQNQNSSTKRETSKKLERQDKNLAKGSNSNNNLMNLNKDIKIVNKYEMTQYINKISNILERIAFTYQINKNEKSYKIYIGKNINLIDYDILIKEKDIANFFDLDNIQFIKYASFVKFVNYLQKIVEIISKEYGAKDFVGIKLLFEHEKLDEKQNKNGIFNLTCHYGTFSRQKTEVQLKYKDENVLLNGFNQGFLALLCELKEIL